MAFRANRTDRRAWPPAGKPIRAGMQLAHRLGMYDAINLVAMREWMGRPNDGDLAMQLDPVTSTD